MPTCIIALPLQGFRNMLLLYIRARLDVSKYVRKYVTLQVYMNMHQMRQVHKSCRYMLRTACIAKRAV